MRELSSEMALLRKSRTLDEATWRRSHSRFKPEREVELKIGPRVSTLTPVSQLSKSLQRAEKAFEEPTTTRFLQLRLSTKPTSADGNDLMNSKWETGSQSLPE